MLDENIYLTYTRRKLGLTMHSQTKLLFHQLGKGFQEFQTISKLVSGRFQLTENGLLDSRFVWAIYVYPSDDIAWGMSRAAERLSELARKFWESNSSKSYYSYILTLK